MSFVVLTMVFALVAACGAPRPVPAPTEAVQVATGATPTSTLSPTATSLPTATPLPTATVTETITPSPVPSLTPTETAQVETPIPAVPAQRPRPDGALLWEDDFAGPDLLAKPLFIGDYMSYQSAGGHGLLSSTYRGGVMPVLYADAQPADFILEVEYRAPAAAPRSSYGIIFRADDAAGGLDYYYFIQVRPVEERVSFAHWQDGEWSAQQEATLSPDLLNDNGFNRVRLEAEGNEFTVFINNIHVFSGVDDSLNAPGILGLAIVPSDALAEGEEDFVYFDNLRIYSAGPELVAAGAGEPTSTAAPEPTKESTATPTPAPRPTARPRATAAPRASPAPVPTSGGSPAALSGRIAVPVYAPDRATYDIYIMDLSNASMVRVMDAASQPALSPDGRQLAFRGWKSDGRGIAAMDTYGGNPRRLTNYFEDALPTWSPDASALAFSSRREGDRKTRLYEVKAYEGADWTVQQGGGPAFGEYPAWGRNNRVIYRTEWPEAGLARMNPDGSDVATLVADGSATAPAPSPGGQAVAYMSQAGGSWDIYRVNADGSGRVRLTDNGANDGLPAWSPDGRSIAFLSDRSGRWALWVMNADGSAQRKVADLPGPPDGRVGGEPDYSSRGWTDERISWAP
jgi:hypothetical protein